MNTLREEALARDNRQQTLRLVERPERNLDRFRILQVEQGRERGLAIRPDKDEAEATFEMYRARRRETGWEPCQQ